MTDQELKDLVASLALSHEKIAKEQEKISEQQKKTDEQIRENAKQQKQTDKLVKETSKQQKKTDEQMKKTDARLDKVAKQLGGISNNQGDIAEEYFVNSLEDKLKIGEIDFDYLIQNFKAKKSHKILAEYDILLVNGKSVAIVEVKYKVHPNDLKQLPKKIESLKKLKQYEGYNIYAGIAGFYMPDEVVSQAKKDGFFVLQRKGDIVVTHMQNLKVA